VTALLDTKTAPSRKSRADKNLFLKKCGKGEIYRIDKRVVANDVIISYVTSNY